MHIRILSLTLAAAALLAPAAARAQGAQAPSATDTADAAPRSALQERWSRPFAVSSRGEARAAREEREVVWLAPAAVRAARTAAAAAALPVDSIEAPVRVASRDSARTPARATTTRDSARTPPRTTTTTRDSARTPARTTTTRDSVRTPPARTAARDSVRAPTTANRGSFGDSIRIPTRSSASSAAEAEDDGDLRPDERAPATRPRDAAPAPRTPAATGRGRTHTVVRGETFYGIARRYAVTTAQLRALNPDVDWESLEVGTVLVLPAGARTEGSSSTPASRPATPPARPAAPARTTPAPAARRRTHTVQTGDTLFGLARRYGVTVEAIRRANDLEGDNVRLGQVLVIPAG